MPHLQLDRTTLQLEGPLGRSDLSDADSVLLRALAAQPDHRLSSAQLLALLGKTLDVAPKRALEVQIVRLRRKFQRVGASDPVIKAIRGHGYQLCIPLLITDSTSSLSRTQSI